jgi:hypothetical protein
MLRSIPDNAPDDPAEKGIQSPEATEKKESATSVESTDNYRRGA